jgi:hypothetical protein
MTQTASVPEILAAVVNAVGILLAWRMLMLTKARHDAVLNTGGTRGGPRILAAFRHFRCETGRIAYHVVSLGFGLWSMTLPAGGSVYGETAMWARVLLGLMFTVMSLFDLASDGRMDTLLRSSGSGEAS